MYENYLLWFICGWPWKFITRFVNSAVFREKYCSFVYLIQRCTIYLISCWKFFQSYLWLHIQDVIYFFRHGFKILFTERKPKIIIRRHSVIIELFCSEAHKHIRQKKSYIINFSTQFSIINLFLNNWTSFCIGRSEKKKRLV